MPEVERLVDGRSAGAQSNAERVVLPGFSVDSRGRFGDVRCACAVAGADGRGVSTACRAGNLR